MKCPLIFKIFTTKFVVTWSSFAFKKSDPTEKLTNQSDYRKSWLSVFRKLEVEISISNFIHINQKHFEVKNLKNQNYFLNKLLTERKYANVNYLI